jgi:hypothetical protein
MSINNFGDLKAKISSTLFHSRFASEYADYTTMFEAAANRRLRVRQMEAMLPLTTVGGEVALPADYLVWRTIRPNAATHWPWDELEYVHPAYLPTTATTLGRKPRLFCIEGNTLRIRPIDDANPYEFHYYQKIPTIAGSDIDSNWLLTTYPDLYVAGVMTELFVKQRNMEGAQLEKARRDELFVEIIQLSALTTGATSPSVRTAEYF